MVLVDDCVAAGSHIVLGSGKNKQGFDVPSGVYILKMETDYFA